MIRIVQVIVLLLLALISVRVFFRLGKKRNSGIIHRSGPPSILLVGPQGAGKTTLFHLWSGSSEDESSKSKKVKTVTSISPNVSDHFKLVPKLQLIDCPGNTKLQQFTLRELKEGNPKAVIFVVDASVRPETIKECVPTLFTVLSNVSKQENVPVLIAVNKTDQFSALSVNKVQSLLEEELTVLLDSQSKGLASSVDSFHNNDSDHHLLGVQGDKVKLSELKVPVEVLAGSALTPKLDKWEQWVQNKFPSSK